MAKKGERGRCATGIEGLDNVLGGGIPTSSIVLLAGSCGTGKTTLAFEYLVRGVISGEPGLLITTVETPDRMISNLPRFRFFEASMLVKSKLSIINLQEIIDSAGLSGSDMDEAAIKKLVAVIAKLVVAHKAKRLVIDTIDSVLMEIKDETLSSMLMADLSAALHRSECTAMLVSSAEKCDRIEGRVADGIIMMDNLERRWVLLRTMQVVKMKGTSHSRSRYVIDLTDAGVLVTPLLKGGV
ncbi:MAG: AAA family ATPase [Methanomassiliicoccales archaeon]|nr:AAA family ATPase [Methanomassiliicoccales archaeon]